MFQVVANKKFAIFRLMASAILSMAFVMGGVTPPVSANSSISAILPPVGMMVQPSAAFRPLTMLGLTINPQNPFQFDFIMDGGQSALSAEDLESESTRLINYFLTALTLPEEQLWVNLSPYEKDRIIPDSLSRTEMGRDMLAQDYLLKQLTASLMYPEDELGRQFWNRIIQKSYQRYGTTELPANTFNKIWIIPEYAHVFTKDNSVFVVDSHLSVMLEEDYLAQAGHSGEVAGDAETMDEATKELIREILIPEIEREINHGESFARLRQIFDAMVLAVWFKKNLKQSVLGEIYVDQNLVRGVDHVQSQVKDQIYQQYLAAFQKGVFDYVREDIDPATQQPIPRKYFSGGVAGIDQAQVSEVTQFPAQLAARVNSAFEVRADLTTIPAATIDESIQNDQAVLGDDGGVPTELPEHVQYLLRTYSANWLASRLVGVNQENGIRFLGQVFGDIYGDYDVWFDMYAYPILPDGGRYSEVGVFQFSRLEDLSPVLNWIEVDSSTVFLDIGGGDARVSWMVKNVLGAREAISLEADATLNDFASDISLAIEAYTDWERPTLIHGLSDDHVDQIQAADVIYYSQNESYTYYSSLDESDPEVKGPSFLSVERQLVENAKPGTYVIIGWAGDAHALDSRYFDKVDVPEGILPTTGSVRPKLYRRNTNTDSAMLAKDHRDQQIKVQEIYDALAQHYDVAIGQPMFRDSERVGIMSEAFHRSPDGTRVPVETDIYSVTIEAIPQHVRDWLRDNVVADWLAIFEESATPVDHFISDKQTYHLSISVIQDVAANADDAVGTLARPDERLSSEARDNILAEIRDIVASKQPVSLTPIGARIGPDGTLILVFEYDPSIYEIRAEVIDAVNRQDATYTGRPKPMVHATLTRTLDNPIVTEAMWQRLKSFEQQYRSISSEDMGLNAPLQITQMEYSHEVRWMHSEVSAREILPMGLLENQLNPDDLLGLLRISGNDLKRIVAEQNTYNVYDIPLIDELHRKGTSKKRIIERIVEEVELRRSVDSWSMADGLEHILREVLENSIDAFMQRGDFEEDFLFGYDVQVTEEGIVIRFLDNGIRLFVAESSAEKRIQKKVYQSRYGGKNVGLSIVQRHSKQDIDAGAKVHLVDLAQKYPSLQDDLAFRTMLEIVIPGDAAVLSSTPSPVRSITLMYPVLKRLKIKAFDEGSQSEVFTAANWNFVLKAFPRIHQSIFVLENYERYQPYLGGLVPPYQVIRLLDTFGRYLNEAVVMTKVEGPNLFDDIRAAHESGDNALVEKILSEFTGLMNELFDRGLLMPDVKLLNFKRYEGRYHLLDAGVILDPAHFRDRNQDVEIVAEFFMQRHLENIRNLSVVGGDDLVARYRNAMASLDLHNGEGFLRRVETMPEEKVKASMPNISSEIVGSLHELAGVEYQIETGDDKAILNVSQEVDVAFKEALVFAGLLESDYQAELSQEFLEAIRIGQEVSEAQIRESLRVIIESSSLNVDRWQPLANRFLNNIKPWRRGFSQRLQRQLESRFPMSFQNRPRQIFPMILMDGTSQRNLVSDPIRERVANLIAWATIQSDEFEQAIVASPPTILVVSNEEYDVMSQVMEGSDTFRSVATHAMGERINPRLEELLGPGVKAERLILIGEKHIQLEGLPELLVLAMAELLGAEQTTEAIEQLIINARLEQDANEFAVMLGFHTDRQLKGAFFKSPSEAELTRAKAEATEYLQTYRYGQFVVVEDIMERFQLDRQTTVGLITAQGFQREFETAYRLPFPEERALQKREDDQAVLVGEAQDDHLRDSPITEIPSTSYATRYDPVVDWLKDNRYLNLSDLPAGSVFVDVGASHGYGPLAFARMLSGLKSATMVYGVDRKDLVGGFENNEVLQEEAAGMDNLRFVSDDHRLTHPDSPKSGVKVITSFNVWMYYKPDQRRAAVREMADKLDEDGLLIIGFNSTNVETRGLNFVVLQKKGDRLIPRELVFGHTYRWLTNNPISGTVRELLPSSFVNAFLDFTLDNERIQALVETRNELFRTVDPPQIIAEAQAINRDILTEQQNIIAQNGFQVRRVNEDMIAVDLSSHDSDSAVLALHDQLQSMVKLLAVDRQKINAALSRAVTFNKALPLKQALLDEMAEMIQEYGVDIKNARLFLLSHFFDGRLDFIMPNRSIEGIIVERLQIDTVDAEVLARDMEKAIVIAAQINSDAFIRAVRNSRDDTHFTQVRANEEPVGRMTPVEVAQFLKRHELLAPVANQWLMTYGTTSDQAMMMDQNIAIDDAALIESLGFSRHTQRILLEKEITTFGQLRRLHRSGGLNQIKGMKWPLSRVRIEIDQFMIDALTVTRTVDRDDQAVMGSVDKYPPIEEVDFIRYFSEVEWWRRTINKLERFRMEGLIHGYGVSGSFSRGQYRLGESKDLDLAIMLTNRPFVGVSHEALIDFIDEVNADETAPIHLTLTAFGPSFKFDPASSELEFEVVRQRAIVESKLEGDSYRGDRFIRLSSELTSPINMWRLHSKLVELGPLSVDQLRGLLEGKVDQAMTIDTGTDVLLVSDIQPINRVARFVNDIRDLDSLVEAPLLEAARELYRKGIRTYYSTANATDIANGRAAMILFLYDELTDNNKSVARSIGIIDNDISVIVRIPMTATSTVEEISQKALALVGQFDTQEMSPVTAEIENYRSSDDEALLGNSLEQKGGIDFNPANMELKEFGDRKSLSTPLIDPTIGNILGIKPVIIHVVPITNLPLLLGLKDTTESPLAADSLPESKEFLSREPVDERSLMIAALDTILP